MNASKWQRLTTGQQVQDRHLFVGKGLWAYKSPKGGKIFAHLERLSVPVEVYAVVLGNTGQCLVCKNIIKVIHNGESRIRTLVERVEITQLHMMTDADAVAAGYADVNEFAVFWDIIHNIDGARWQDDPKVVVSYITRYKDGR